MRQLKDASLSQEIGYMLHQCGGHALHVRGAISVIDTIRSNAKRRRLLRRLIQSISSQSVARIEVFSLGIPSNLEGTNVDMDKVENLFVVHVDITWAFIVTIDPIADLNHGRIQCCSLRLRAWDIGVEDYVVELDVAAVFLELGNRHEHGGPATN